ncbi:hypothetical protein [Trichothermofontia sp.]
MTDWQFLIQKAGDRAWLPLDASSTEILEGRYRIVARCDRSNTPAEIRITHYAIAEIPPKRRMQRRSSRVNADGLMMILPFTLLKPGLWEVRCMADVMADFFGESWSYGVRLEVLANSETQEEWDDPDPLLTSEPATVEIAATAVVVPKPTVAPTPLLPSPSPIAPALDPALVPPSDLPLVATTPTESTPSVPDPSPQPAIAAVSTLAADLDQAMQTLLAALATSPLDLAAPPGAADLGPLTPADQAESATMPPPVPGELLDERLQAIAQQISDQVVERALQEFDLDAVFSGLQELLEGGMDATVPADPSLSPLAAGPQAAPGEAFPYDRGGEATPGSEEIASLIPEPSPLPDADLLPLGPLQLALEQEAYVVRRGQPLRLQGQVSPSSAVTAITTAAIGELQLCLRDPQTLKVLAHTWQLLPIATLPVDFCCEVNIPTDCATQLLLGEVNLVQLTQADAPPFAQPPQGGSVDDMPWAERQRLQQEAAATGRVLAHSSAQTAHLLATYAFTIAADVADLLPNGVLVPDPQVIAPTPPRPERPALALPLTNGQPHAPRSVRSSPAAKAPGAEEFLLPHPPVITTPDAVDLPVFAGDFQPQRPKSLVRSVNRLSVSFIEISKRSPAASVPTQPAVLQPLPEQIYHPDPDTLRQISPKLPAIPSLSEQFAAQADPAAIESPAAAAVNSQVELVLTHASVALPPLAHRADLTQPSDREGVTPAQPEALTDAEGTGDGTADQGDTPAAQPPSLRSLNLGRRFWSRLNAIAADAALADWLREQAEAEADSPAVGAVMRDMVRIREAATVAEGWPAAADAYATPEWESDDGDEADWEGDDWAEHEAATLADAWDDGDEADGEGDDWAEHEAATLADAWDDDGFEDSLADEHEVVWNDDDFEDNGEATGEAASDSPTETLHDREVGEIGAGALASGESSPYQALQALTPDPTLTAEMEIFLDLLAQGPDWSPTEVGHAETPPESAAAASPDGESRPDAAPASEASESEDIPASANAGVADLVAGPAAPEPGSNPMAAAGLTAREIEAMLTPEAAIAVPPPPAPRPSPHAEILIEDEAPLPTSLSPGRVLSHPSLFYRLADDEPVPVPLISLPNQELVAGQSITLCVRLAKTPARIQVKVWVQDRQTRQVLDGPRWLVDFFPCGQAVVEAWTQLTVPLGCLEIQFEAIAIEIYSQRESHKTSLNRSVMPPDLALPNLGSQGYWQP